MQSLVVKLSTLVFCLFSISLFAEDIRDNSTGITFPSEVSFSENGKEFRLKATGVATRKKFFVKVYSIASYLQEGQENNSQEKFAQIMQDDKAKQLIIKWFHEASAEKVQDGYRESFRNALSDGDYNQLQKEIETYVHFFNQNVQKGDEHILRWLPDGNIVVLINGNKAGNITNQAFAKGLWNIWFGPHSVVDRNNLISLMK